MRIVIDISEYDKEWIGNAYGIPQDINTKIAKAIINAEPCQPEPHWIPVTELPKYDFMPYYATCRSKVDDRENWVIEGMYTKYSGWECPPMVRDGRAEIIAWMPKELPEPYKG